MARNLGSRNLWIYATANAVSGFGSQFQFLAVTAYTYALTHSPLATGVQMAISGVPYILGARWAGLPADRYDPRKVTAVVSLMQSALTLLYLLVDSVAAIVALNFLVASAGIFLPPARAALLPQKVGSERLLQANARLATFRGAVQLLAPALAGTILVRTGANWAFAFNSFSYLIPAAAMALIRPVAPRQAAAAAEPAPGAAVQTPPAQAPTSGAAAQGQPTDQAPPPGGKVPADAPVSASSLLRLAPGLGLLLAAYGAYALGMWSVNAIFYPYATEVLGGGADVMGWSVSCYFGAYTVTGLALERWGQRLRDPRLLLGGYLVGALVWVGYTLTRSIPWALALSAFDGIIFTYAFTLFETRVQEESPPALRGRIFALAGAYDEFCTVSGQILGGALATYVGIRAGIGWSALLTAVPVLAVAGVLRARGRRGAAATAAD